MALFPVLLFLAAVLLPFFPANGKKSAFDAISTTEKEVQREIVKKHNDVRRLVFPRARDMLKMQWDSNAAENSQKWANKCTFQHSDQNDRKVGKRNCGENIFMSSKPTPWSKVIKAWFNEGINFIYGYGAKRSDIVVGHYTQVVWYSSYLVGCGVAYCPKQQNLKYYYICHYCPSGNIGVGRSLFPYGKGKPCGSCPNNCDLGLCTNPCEHDDVYSNCRAMMSEMGCKNDFVKENCKAACNCSNKIY